MAIRDKLAIALWENHALLRCACIGRRRSHGQLQRQRQDGIGAALGVVGLSGDRAAKEAQIREDMIRVARRSGASLRQLAEVSGLDRMTVTAIVAQNPRAAA